MISTQQVSQTVAFDVLENVDSSSEQVGSLSLYAQLTLRTKLILPYLFLALFLAIAAVYLSAAVWQLSWNASLFVGGITAVLITLVGHQHATMLAEPIEDLTIASLRVGAGDYSIAVVPNTADELGQLAENFNLMTDQLRQHEACQVEKQHQVEDLFGQYVGSNIARHILSGEAALGGRRVYATVLFADIRNFTAFSEKANLSELIAELNEYYTLMQEVIEAHGGVINKFGGDSLLALFGAPRACVQHARQGIEAALAMSHKLAHLNQQRCLRGQAPIRIGIGVNYGEMIIGNFGSEQRREYTVLGDSVNVAKRLSDLNKELPFESIFVSEATLRQINGRWPWQVRDLGDIVFKGKEAAVTVHAVMPPLIPLADLAVVAQPPLQQLFPFQQ